MTLSTLPEYDKTRIATHDAQAVVVGAGVAGLSAARVLADYFTRVTILERDDLPESPQPRRGVPQGTHMHNLFTSGKQTLDDLLSGYSEDLLAADAVENDFGSDWMLYTQGGFRADTPNRMPILSASRPLFEQILRRRVTELDAVEVRSSHHFLNYVTSEADSTVTGVLFRNEAGDEETIAAEVIVDATGRTSKTPRWLETHGYSAPPKDEVHADVAYSTGFIERPPDDVRTILIDHRGRSAGVVPIENDQWQVGVGGRGGNRPPLEPEKVETFIEDLPVPILKELFDDHDWRSTEIFHYPFLSNQRYRYEDLDGFPDGLLVMGDAIASFNPTFGQGMTVAIFEALVLHHTLAETGLDDLARRFFQRVGEVVDTPWFQAVAVDSAYPGGIGPTPAGVDSYREYLGRLGRVAHDDGEVAEAYNRVIQLERPLSSLLQPTVVRRVFDDTDEETIEKEPSAWVPASLSEVGLLLEENLTNPKEVVEWPGVSSDSQTGLSVPISSRVGADSPVLSLARTDRPPQTARFALCMQQAPSGLLGCRQGPRAAYRA